MEIRLNKFLSEAGVCSRREADRLIESGKVTVDGKRADVGMKISDSQIVRVGKKEIRPKNEMVLLAVNKPVGIVCTEENTRNLSPSDDKFIKLNKLEIIFLTSLSVIYSSTITFL